MPISVVRVADSTFPAALFPAAQVRRDKLASLVPVVTRLRQCVSAVGLFGPRYDVRGPA
jgi:hypothetical protein